MKCTNKRALCIFLLFILILSGCGYKKFDLPYSADSNISSFSMVNFERSNESAESFATNLCVSSADINTNTLDLPTGSAAGLFDINSKNTIYAKNAHTHMYPASLTKIMTAIVALKNGTSDMILSASQNVVIDEFDAQVMNLKPGDSMTLDQALHIMLMYSANDVALMIAENIGGSIDHFVEMMNDEAVRLGATNTHFTNPHGLTSDDHYTTSYDLYLIMNEAIQYDLFNEIIQMSTYETVYYDAAGNEKNLFVSSTNLYTLGKESAPTGITVLGGKTGTTNAAGNCLVLISKDVKSNPYISVVLNASSKEDLYNYTSSLLSQINK